MNGKCTDCIQFEVQTEPVNQLTYSFSNEYFLNMIVCYIMTHDLIMEQCFCIIICDEPCLLLHVSGCVTMFIL